MSKPLFAPWPNGPQRLLLDAALAPGSRAIAAFDQWHRSVDLEAEIGWSSVRLMPLAYRNLSRHGCADPRMGLLKGVYRRVWLETNQLFHRTAPVLRALTAEGIDVLLLKGAPIALQYYRNLALRAMSDLDVCVRIDQLEEAARVLGERGWKARMPIGPMALKYRHSVEYHHEQIGTIDLHWHVFKETPHAEADARFWSASEPLDFLGVPVRQLHPEDALLHGMIHGLCSNPDPPIRWITDSMAILTSRGADIEWPRLLLSAERHRVLHRFALGSLYLAEHHEAAIPEVAVNTLGSANRTWIERLEERILLQAHPRPPLGWDWRQSFVRYCRYAHTANPLKFAYGYFVFRYLAETRRDMAIALARKIRRFGFPRLRRAAEW
jgi:hypothetical protein